MLDRGLVQDDDGAHAPPYRVSSADHVPLVAMIDPHAAKSRLLRDAVLNGPCESSPAEREAAARGVGEGPVGSYVEKVARQATEVTDADVAALREAGLSDVRIFELTVAAATGAGFRRLDRVRALLGAS